MESLTEAASYGIRIEAVSIGSDHTIALVDTSAMDLEDEGNEVSPNKEELEGQEDVI